MIRGEAYRGLGEGRGGAASWLLLALLMAASVLPRVPLFVNADLTLTSDEAVNALVIKHLVQRHELTAFNWDATYYGIVEGLLALPFVAFLGFAPLAFKLGAFLGHLLLMLAAFLLGRRLYGDGGGLAAAALLVGFSPQLVQWSTIAAVGYCLIVAWGTLTLLHLDRLLRALSAGGLAGLGLLIGFGLYLYELYLVYVALLAAGAMMLVAGRLLRGRGRRPAVPAPGFTWPRGILLFAAGFALGWAPKLWLLATGAAGSKRPSYGLVPSLALLKENLRLFFELCAQAFLGINLTGNGVLEIAVGPDGPLARAAGIAVVALYGAAWLWAALRVARRWLAGEGAGVEGLLVLLVPLDAALFCLSPNSQGVYANRFLLPWAGSLPLLAGGALATLASAGGRRAAGSRRGAAWAVAWAAGLLLGIYPWAESGAWYLEHDYLAADLRPIVRHEPLQDVLRYLDRQGIRGAYGGYWTAYKATLMSDERLIVAPLDVWDRYPAYTRAVDRLPRAANIFRTDFDFLEPLLAAGARQQLADFENRLAGAARPYRVARIGPYTLYHGPAGERLLAPAAGLTPVPLARPRARIAAGPAPASVAAGGLLSVPVRLTNESDGYWSALGLPLLAGSLRVTASYRWLDPAGRTVVEYGERSLLPADVLPGASLPMVVRARAPETPGTYDLAITLVQENVAWFDQATGSASRRLRVQVLPRAAAARAPSFSILREQEGGGPSPTAALASPRR